MGTLSYHGDKDGKTWQATTSRMRREICHGQATLEGNTPSGQRSETIACDTKALKGDMKSNVPQSSSTRERLQHCHVLIPEWLEEFSAVADHTSPHRTRWSAVLRACVPHNLHERAYHPLVRFAGRISSCRNLIETALVLDIVLTKATVLEIQDLGFLNQVPALIETWFGRVSGAILLDIHEPAAQNNQRCYICVCVCIYIYM